MIASWPLRGGRGRAPWLMLALAVWAAAPGFAQDSRIAVHCVGDSITLGLAYGSGHDYPTLLQRKFREAGLESVRVYNQGAPGDTVGDRLAFWAGPDGQRVFTRRDIHYVTIMLGTNDTRVGDETPPDIYAERMNALIDVFAGHANPDGSKPQVLLSLIPPCNSVADGEPMDDWLVDYFVYPERIPGELNPALEAIALERGLVAIDVYAPMKAAGPALLPDGVHPNGEGHKIIADAFFEALLPLIAPEAGLSKGLCELYK